MSNIYWIFRFKNIPDELEVVRFSSKKIKDLGFRFKYNLEDMYCGAIDACRDKGLLPKPAETSLMNSSCIIQNAKTSVNGIILN